HLLDLTGRNPKRSLAAEGYAAPQMLPNGTISPRPPTDLSQFAYGRPFAAAFSPDGRTLAVAAVDAVRVIELATGKERGRLKGHDGSVAALAFAPHGGLLATASLDTTLLLWDLKALGRG